jgi:hypothetical protein
MSTTEPLTQAERDIILALGVIYQKIAGIVGISYTRDDDLREARNHIHTLQHMVMAQAAARSYPKEFRLLGETIKLVDTAKEGAHERSNDLRHDR